MWKQNYDFSIKFNKLISELELLKNKKIAIYGYGTIGKFAYSILKDKVSIVIDKNADFISREELDCSICTPQNLNHFEYDIIVITVLGREDEILNFLVQDLGIARSGIKTLDFLNAKTDTLKISEHDKKGWLALKDKYSGERCFIIGNGPSLNLHDLSLLNNEYTFGVNGIFYKTQEIGFKPTFYVVEDSHVIEDNLDIINNYSCEYKFFPTKYKNKILPSQNTIFFEYERGFYDANHPFYEKPRFSYDCADVVFAGQTVTYSNLQIAFYLGFMEIYLIGMDFSYAVPDSTDIRGDTYISNEDDVNHFHPSYFGKGKKWHDPKLDKVALNFELARQVYEQNGRKIYNLTIGGKLELFEKNDWYDVMKVKKHD